MLRRVVSILSLLCVALAANATSASHAAAGRQAEHEVSDNEQESREIQRQAEHETLEQAEHERESRETLEQAEHDADESRRSETRHEDEEARREAREADEASRRAARAADEESRREARRADEESRREARSADEESRREVREQDEVQRREEVADDQHHGQNQAHGQEAPRNESQSSQTTGGEPSNSIMLSAPNHLGNNLGSVVVAAGVGALAVFVLFSTRACKQEVSGDDAYSLLQAEAPLAQV